MELGVEEMEALCAENCKRGSAIARSVTAESIFFSPASVMCPARSQIGNRHANLVADGDKQSF